MITGTIHGSVVLTVRQRTRYYPKQAKVVAAGNYGGFALGNDRPFLWSIYVPRDQPTLPGESSSDGVLEPGHYLVRLFSGGWPVTAILPWDADTMRVSATGPLAASVTVNSAPIGPDGTGATAVPLHLHESSRAAALVRFDTAAALHQVDLTACVTSNPSRCSGASWTRQVTKPAGEALATGVSQTWHRDKPRAAADWYLRGEVHGDAPGPLHIILLAYAT